MLGPGFVAFAFLVATGASVIPGLAVRSNPLEYNEDAHLTTTQLIEKYGYHAELHNVTTESGYVLEMHRITGPSSDRSPNGKDPVLLMHGVLSSSVDWVITGPERALAYLLADEGYDVWLGNTRGNTFSRGHKKYSTRDKEYWQFSWHEVGCSDLPAMIDHVLEKTSREKLVYVGHSQGTTAFWVMSSERSEYQDKIKVMFALAPVAYLTHMTSPFYQVLSRFGSNVEKIMEAMGYYEFKPSSDLLKEVMAAVCNDEAWTQPMCTNIIFLVAGFGSEQLNRTMLPAILGHVPAGASVMEMAHFGQVMKARKFQLYDHGKLGNWKRYGRFTPPSYDLSKIRVPVSLHYSSNDMFVNPKDVDRLYKELANSIGKFRVPHARFTHLDFIWATDGRELLYHKIVGLMQRYRG